MEAPKKRNLAKARNPQAFEDRYICTAEVCDLIGGRNGRSAHPNTVAAMVRDGRLPPPDIGGGRAGFKRWRQSRIVKALQKLERRAA